MKVLYAIQGTGNGHLSRAREVVPILKELAETDVLVSGYQADVELPFKVNFRYKGLSFIFGKRGGIDFFKTIFKSNIIRLFNEIYHAPVKKYDLVINDFEPVSAWASKLKGVPCISLSHQAAVKGSNAPRPLKRDFFGEIILKYYSPVKESKGFHFKEYDKSTFTPVIRDEIRKLKSSDKGFYLVYLPSFSDQILCKILKQVSNVKWHVFSKHSKNEKRQENIWVRPVNNKAFVSDLANCSGVLCGAGFEAPAESIYLGKKLMVIPMKSQYEQACNAAALKNLGVPVLEKLNEGAAKKIQDWVNDSDRVWIDYQNQTRDILETILQAKQVVKEELPSEVVLA